MIEGPPSLLKHVLIVSESEAAAHTRLLRHGFEPALAREIAVYLAQATDLPEHAAAIGAALASRGIGVSFVELDAAALAIPRLDPAESIVWCQTDGIRFYRGSAVPALARLAGIARYGSPPTTQHLCQDKFASLAMASAAGVPIPATLLLDGDEVLGTLGALDEAGELFVKPATLGAKIGIFADSRCRGLPEARVLSRRIRDRYGDRAVVQPFIAGDDVRVSFMNTGRDFVSQLGVARLRQDPAGEAGGSFMTMRDNETLSGARDTAGTRGAFGRERSAAFVPAMDDLKRDPASAALVASVTAAAARLATMLPLTDYFSMDFRVDAAGQPTFLEFETCPAVTIYDFQHYLRTEQDLDLGEALARSMVLAHGRRLDAKEA